MCLQRSPLVWPRATGSSSPGRKQNIWMGTHWVWKPCNPLKSHKTAKAFFGKAWSKTSEIWKGLHKSLEARLNSAGFAPGSRLAYARPDEVLAHPEFGLEV